MSPRNVAARIPERLDDHGAQLLLQVYTAAASAEGAKALWATATVLSSTDPEAIDPRPMWAEQMRAIDPSWPEGQPAPVPALRKEAPPAGELTGRGSAREMVGFVRRPTHNGGREAAQAARRRSSGGGSAALGAASPAGEPTAPEGAPEVVMRDEFKLEPGRPAAATVAADDFADLLGPAEVIPIPIPIPIGRSRRAPALPYHDGPGVIPHQLREARRWTPWGDGKAPGPDGRLDKRPHLESNRPEKWLPYPEAVALAKKTGASGVGYHMLGSEEVIAVDLDGVVKRRDPATGEVELSPRGRRLLDAFPGTYAEVSPSGRGLRIFALRPEGFDLTGDTVHKFKDGSGEGVEVYIGAGARYVTATGWALPGRERRISAVPTSALAAVEAEGVRLKRGATGAAGVPGGKVPDVRRDEGWREKVAPVLDGTDLSLLDEGAPGGSYGSRSEHVAAVIARLTLRGMGAEEIFRVLLSADGTWRYALDHRNGDEGGAREFLWREAERGVEFAKKEPSAEDDFADAPGDDGGAAEGQVRPEVEALNREWFVLPEAGKVFACRFELDAFGKGRRRRLVYFQFADFVRLHERTRWTKGKRRVTLGEAWLAWKRRRQYDRAVFDPAVPSACAHGAEESCALCRRHGPRTLNLWDGFKVEPVPGDWSIIRQHIEEIICSGNRRHADYLLGWIAHMFQHPERLPEVAVVLRGLEGVGKDFLGYLIRRVLGQHGLMVSNPDHLIGKHNVHLRDAVFLHSEEALYAGDPRHDRLLKALVTGDTLAIEPKFVNLFHTPNRLHVFMTANPQHVVRAGANSRRYFVLDVADTHASGVEPEPARRAYFAPLFAAADDDQVAGAFLHDLLHMDLSGFDVRAVPVTNALLDQRELSADPLLAWAQDVAERGHLLSDFEGGMWREFYATEELHEDYQTWAKRAGVRATLALAPFGRQLGKVLKLGQKCEAPWGLRDSMPERLWRRRGYAVGTLDDFRRAVRRVMGIEGEDDLL